MGVDSFGDNWYWYDGKELYVDVHKLLVNYGLDDEEIREMAVDEVQAVLLDVLRPAPGYKIRARPEKECTLGYLWNHIKDSIILVRAVEKGERLEDDDTPGGSRPGGRAEP